MSSIIRARRVSLSARIFVVAVATVFSVVFATIAPQGAQATTTPTYAQMMQRVVDDTNIVRAAAGLRPLVRNAEMDRVAAAWSLQQWKNGTMSHNPYFSTQIPSGWSRAGENVAKGYSYLQVVSAWKGSPGHYANMVNDYTSIGIGYFEQDGRRYWTQLFAKYSGVTLPALSSITSALLQAVTPPTVTGNAAVGSTWTLNTGTWSGTPTKVVQAWLRCNQPVGSNVVAVPVGCVAISGATGTKYVSTIYDAGKYITAQVAAINLAGATNIVALSSVATTGPTIPAATVKPTVTGNAKVGSTWTLNTGTWSGSPTKIVQAWLRCNAPVTSYVVAVPAGCVATGARGTTYVSTSYDAGKYITAQVAAINAAGATNIVALGSVATTGPTVPAATVKPTVTGNAKVGSTWTLNTGTWSGSPTKIVQAWLRCNAPVTSYVVAVPAGCVATGARGTSYVSTSYDAGKYITAQVAAINAAGATNIVALSTVATTGPTVPAATVKPTVTGNAAIGSTWTLNTGTWSGSPTKIVQAWLRCNAPVTSYVVAVPAGCVATGARGTSYVSTSYDAGKYITAQVAAINAAGATNIVALSTVATTGPTAPVATVAPTVTGNAAIGSTWTLDTGTWSGSPTKIIQAWLRCSAPVTSNVVAVPAGCVATGVTGTSYLSTSSDAGKYITAQVAAFNAAGVTNIVAVTTDPTG